MRNQNFEALLLHSNSREMSGVRGEQVGAVPSLGPTERSSKARPQQDLQSLPFPLERKYTHKAGLGPEDGLAKGGQAGTQSSGFQPSDSQASGKG